MKLSILLSAIAFLAMAAHDAGAAAPHKKQGAGKQHRKKEVRAPVANYVEPLQAAVATPVDLSVPQRLPDR